MVKVHKCKERQQTFLSWKEFDTHVNRHLQKHLDGMNRKLKVFEKYRLGDKSMLCLWRNGYLSSALRERSRELELQTRLSEWLKE